MIYVMWLLVFVWLVSVLLTVYGLARKSSLSASNDPSLTSNDAPFVSVIVAARNEEHRVLKDSVRSILAQDYERFEVIAVDDRSTDQTRPILKLLAGVDGRLRVIDGNELPSGWLGKPYAMHQALSFARGEWILATDADMIFEKSAIRTAMARITEQEADAMTLIPHFETHSFWERVMIPAWAWVMLMFAVSYRINNPKSKGALGLGGFILMRRTVLDRIGGYEALQNEVTEDVRLAERIKSSGGRMLVADAPTLLSTRMYSNFGEIWESCTKSWFAGMKFSLPFAVVCVAWMYLMAVVPFVVVIVFAILDGVDAIMLPAMLCWLGQVIVLVIVGLRSGVSPVYAFTAPLGLALLYAMLLDSSMSITIGKGVMWKGRRIYERAGVSPPKLSVR